MENGLKKLILVNIVDKKQKHGHFKTPALHKQPESKISRLYLDTYLGLTVTLALISSNFMVSSFGIPVRRAAKRPFITTATFPENLSGIPRKVGIM